MTTREREILDDYVSALERELNGLPAVDRAEIVLEVRDHFEAASAELEEPTEVDLRNILERLGSPQEIAAEARQRLGASPATEPSAIATPNRAGLLEIAALLGWILWTPVGVLLTALSPRWSRRTKAIAVLVELLTLALLMSFFSTPAFFSGQPTILHLVFFALAFFMPPTLLGIPAAAYLVFKLSRTEPHALPSPWRQAALAGLVLLGGWLVFVLVIGPLALLLMKAS